MCVRGDTQRGVQEHSCCAIRRCHGNRRQHRQLAGRGSRSGVRRLDAEPGAADDGGQDSTAETHPSVSVIARLRGKIARLFCSPLALFLYYWRRTTGVGGEGARCETARKVSSNTTEKRRSKGETIGEGRGDEKGERAEWRREEEDLKGEK